MQAAFKIRGVPVGDDALQCKSGMSQQNSRIVLAVYLLFNGASVRAVTL